MSQVADRIFETFGPTEPTASEFFAVFSRFESALKGSRYCKDDGKPDWNNYYGKCLKNDENIKGEIDALFVEFKALFEERKLQTHKCKEGNIEWKPAKIDQNTTIFDLINIIRNNLFHGGKFEFGQDIDYDKKRNEKLVHTCLRVLYTCLKNKNDVTKAFYSELDLGEYGENSVVGEDY